MRLRLPFVAAAAFCAAASFPGTAAAAPRWSAPFTISTAAVGKPGVAVDGRGGALFATTYEDGVLTRQRSSAGVFGELTPLVSPLPTRFHTDPVPALNTRGDAIVVWTQRDARGAR